MSFFISRLYIRGLSSVKKDDIPFFSNRKPTQSTTEPFMKEDSDRINMKTINFLWSQKAEEIKKRDTISKKESKALHNW